MVVIKDIFRKYPNKYESIIATLCENLDTLDEPEARASMIWIIGEYAERSGVWPRVFCQESHVYNSGLTTQMSYWRVSWRISMTRTVRSSSSC